MLNKHIITVNPLAENCIVVWDETRECVIFDPGCCNAGEDSAVKDFIASKNLTPKFILMTHNHFDHSMGVKRLAGFYGIPVRLAPEDDFLMEFDADACRMFGLTWEGRFDTEAIHDCDKVIFGAHEFEVITTPGHTPGSVAYYCHSEKLLISGDTLFAGAIGRTDLPGGDYDRLMESINGKLMGLEGDVEVIPGHGPATTIADERQKNPFLLPFNLPEDAEE